MKQKILTFLLLFGLFTHTSSADIDAQIEAIKNASVEERFKLMNAFKKNLIQMKEEERIKAMTKLTTKSNNKHAIKALKSLKDETKRQKIRKQLEYHHIKEDNIVNQTTDTEGGENDD